MKNRQVDLICEMMKVESGKIEMEIRVFAPNNSNFEDQMVELVVPPLFFC